MKIDRGNDVIDSCTPGRFDQWFAEDEYEAYMID